MHGLNSALERLRLALPNADNSVKMTKIETLQMANKYIWSLTHALQMPPPPPPPSNFSLNNHKVRYIHACTEYAAGRQHLISELVDLSISRSCVQ